jgi:hypothetical protein
MLFTVFLLGVIFTLTMTNNQQPVTLHTSSELDSQSEGFFKLTTYLNDANIQHVLGHASALGQARYQSVIPWDSTNTVLCKQTEKSNIMKVLETQSDLLWKPTAYGFSLTINGHQGETHIKLLIKENGVYHEVEETHLEVSLDCWSNTSLKPLNTRSFKSFNNHNYITSLYGEKWQTESIIEQEPVSIWFKLKSIIF